MADDPESAGPSIVGIVCDQFGNPHNGVLLVASSPTQIGGARRTYSDDNGLFAFRHLTPGDFEVAASSPPEPKPVTAKGIRVRTGPPAEVTIILEVPSPEQPAPRPPAYMPVL
jgi:hypothetical protein